MTTIADALTGATDRLALHESARLDAEILLAEVLGRGRTYLYAWPERALSAVERAQFEHLVGRRVGGEPVAYLLGRREFWSLDLVVSPATLIPRPETESLVQAALERIPAEQGLAVADLGTGSGAVALAIARERPLSRVCAVDRSEAALAVARENVRRHGTVNIELFAGSWFEPLVGRRFAVVVSNPPYVAEGDSHLGSGDVRFEPQEALVSGHDGLAAIRALVSAAPGHLDPGGWLLIEHGCDQGGAVRTLLCGTGFEHVSTVHDPAGHERITVGRQPRS